MNTEVNQGIQAKAALAEKAGGATMKLFSVQSVVKSYRGCRNVHIAWFIERGESKPHRPYAELIKDYDPSSWECQQYTEGAIDDMFTEEEAVQLKEYLERANGDQATTTIHEVELPIEKLEMSPGAMPAGGGCDFLMLFKRAGYPLPFEVWGYFDLRHCESLDGSDVYHHQAPDSRVNSAEEIMAIAIRARRNTINADVVALCDWVLATARHGTDDVGVR